MKRLPIRVRLVAGFSAAMFVVLVAAAVFVYWRVEYALDRALDGDLHRATAALEASVSPDGTVPDDRAVGATGAIYQVLDADGNVVAHSPAAGGTPLLPPSGSAEKVDLGRLLPISDRPLRVLATPVTLGGEPATLLVAERRDHRDEALRELVAQLTVAVLGALVVTAGVGYLLARSALAPVERYRRQADEIAAGATGVRLDVPEDRDDEITRLGTTLNDMLAALERAMETERRFVDDASHELRTPLTVLKGRVQLAQQRPRTVEEHETILADLLVDVERLTRLAAQLLELRAESGVPEDVVERIVQNLVTNAELHGGPPVTTEVLERDGWLDIAVSDGGPGMDAAMLDRATERFSRADDARSRPGSGLGLAIVRSLTGAAGGQLLLCSRGEHRSYGADLGLACQHDPSRTTVRVRLRPGS